MRMGRIVGVAVVSSVVVAIVVSGGWRQLPWRRVLPHEGMLPPLGCRWYWVFYLSWSKAVGMWAKGAGGGQRSARSAGVVHGRCPVRRRRIVHMSTACRARSARPPRPRKFFGSVW